MMGKRSNFARNPRDFYPTPPAAVGPLIPHLEYGDMFCEPCAGDGALVKALEAHGMSCAHASDIEPQADWVDRMDALGGDLGGCVQSCEWIITNPPWDRSIMHAMIREFSAIKPTWLLFDADWVHTRQSAPFTPWLRKVVSVGRVKWIEGSKHTGKDNCAWHLFCQQSDGAAEFYGRSAK
jgi:hypothetical protein